MGRAERITNHLKAHDRALFCDKNREGTLCVYRQGKRYDAYKIDEGTLLFTRPSPHYVMALTDTWSTNGRPVDWGIEPIMKRIKQMDLWADETEVDRLFDDYERDEKAIERQIDNNAEAFAKDMRRTFAKAFSDVNTSNMKKIYHRRREDNGYCK